MTVFNTWMHLGFKNPINISLSFRNIRETICEVAQFSHTKKDYTLSLQLQYKYYFLCQRKWFFLCWGWKQNLKSIVSIIVQSFCIDCIITNFNMFIVNKIPWEEKRFTCSWNGWRVNKLSINQNILTEMDIPAEYHMDWKRGNRWK